jgi:hypothetical protein
MQTLGKLLSPLSLAPAAVQDTVVRSQAKFFSLFFFEAVATDLMAFGAGGYVRLQKLVVIGGTVETARRVSSSAWSSFVDCEYLGCGAAQRGEISTGLTASGAVQRFS